MTVELRLFGGASLLTGDGALISGSSAQPRRLAILAILADAWPAPVTRDAIIGLVWPEQDEAGARRLLSQSLYELRKALGEFTRSSGRDIGIDASALAVDLIDFRRAMEQRDFERAAQLYRAPLLDGFHLKGAGEFDRWLSSVRHATERDLRRALACLMDRDEADGNVRGAIEWAARLLELFPFDAELVQRCATLHARAGDPASAIGIAERYERRIRDELELAPDPRVRSATRAALDAPPTPTLVTAARTSPSAKAVAVATSSAPAFVERRARRLPLWRAIVAAATVLIVAAGLRSFEPPHTAAARRVLVIPTFRAQGDSSSVALASAMATMLAASLDGAAGLVVDTAVTSTENRADGWARADGAVTATGHQLRVDVTLSGAGRARAYRVTLTAPSDSVIPLLDRVARELLPRLYPGLDRERITTAARSFAQASTLRRYLDGESAFRRGEFGAAHDAFREVTERDSSLAYVWYRRAMAAEDAHRLDDANRSAATALRGAGRLDERSRRIVEAYVVWRSGDIAEADSLFRLMVRARPNDAEAWVHFAEVAYHGGPLIGHTLDEARDAWRQAVALDSGDFSALMHALRLEARSGNQRAVATLLDRAESIGGNVSLLAEMRAIGNIAVGRGASISLPDASAYFVHSVVASLLERPTEAEVIARRLAAPDAPAAVRAQAHAALAHLAMAQGHRRSAHAQLDTLSTNDPIAAAWWRAYFETLPFLTPSDTGQSRAKAVLASAVPRSTTVPLYLELAVDAPAARILQAYELALLGLSPRGDGDVAFRCPPELPATLAALCTDLGRGVAAESRRRAGRPADALRELEHMEMRVPYQLAGRSAYFARTRERYLRAMLLEQAGRLDEAYQWYSAATSVGRLDYLYLAPSHLARGRIRERQGNRAAAKSHFQRALELWKTPDGELASLRVEAMDGLRRVTESSAP
ncbi:MAG: BTAD domain-containing putative transcriptional regulator [Gemmatimonadota bacterium]